MTDSDTLSIAEAAARLGISEGTAYKLARETGQLAEGLKVLKFGRRMRVGRRALERLTGVAEHTFDTVSPMEPLTREAVERLRRSVAMLQPGAPGLDREDAIRVLAELERLQEGVRDLQRRCESLLRPQ